MRNRIVRLLPLLALGAGLAAGGVPVLTSTALYTDGTTISGNTITTQSCASTAYRDQVVLASRPPAMYLRLDDAAGSNNATDASGSAAWAFAGLASDEYRRDGSVYCDSDRGIKLRGAASSGTAVVSPTLKTSRSYSQVFWINTTTTRGGRVVGARIEQSSGKQKTQIPDRQVWMMDDGRMAAAVVGSGGAVRALQDTVPINDGTWHMVAVTFERNVSFNLYVDGQLVDTTSTASTWTNSDPVVWRLGYDPSASFPTGMAPSDTAITGGVDELAIWESALSASDITTLASASRN